MELATSGGGEEEYELVNTEGRAGRNYILGIKKSVGNWTYDHEEISNCFQDTFIKLFSRPHQDQQVQGSTPSSFDQILRNLNKRVTNDDADSLAKPFTAKEVRQAVFQMGPMKSPGPMVFLVFYQCCWHLVKKDCTKAILSILNSGAVLKEMNRTFIALIPKCDSPEAVKDYRPISLCNVFMRIITKCITNRMQKVMGYLVGDHQNAFLAGRSISDNILLVHEAIHKVNTHKHGKFGKVAFKADMSKAFDRVRWDFLQAVLLTFGFPPRLVNLIMNCVSTVSYEILLNGAPFQAAMWPPARRSSIAISFHPLYGNDSVFFFHNKGMAVRHLKRLLVNYCEASGQVINEDKSGIIFSPNTTLRKGARSITHGLKLIKEHIGWKPGIDSNLNVWDKKWVNGRTPEPKDCLLEEGFIFLKDLRVKDICINNGGWNEDLINLLFAEESVKHILAIPLHSSQPRDELFWPFTSSGIYTVKSGYGILFRDYFNEHGSRKDKARIHANWKLFCRKKLWNLPGPQTWKILLWKIIASSLPIGSEFVKRDMTRASSCALCNNASDSVETLDHLFRDCPLSSRIWAGSGLGMPRHLPNIDVRDWIVNWILYLSKLEDGLNPVLHFLVILVSLWTLRNDIRFRGQPFNPGVFYAKTRHFFKEVLQANDKINNDPLHPPGFETGVPVPSSDDDFDYQLLRAGRPFYCIGSSSSCAMVRIYVDASWKNSCLAGFGWIAFGPDGEISYEGFLRGRAESPLQAEALGLKEAMSWARQAGVLHIEISSDCLSLLTQWMGKQTKHHHIRNILQDITLLSFAFHCLCFSYVRRDCNFRAHALAQQAMGLH
ncbi:uncharacterized protein LOC141651856 [Silene latifolia]|uniref:uncharacterized protein LOC141651856 n=1 Tax=Silene latifolia TaxID=37657 RepID=UPI003D784B4E